jgi:hypothetical protein
VFNLFETASDEERAPAVPGTPGHVGWHELHAGDGPSAFAFYSGLFGWTKAEAMDMGPMGVYQIFATGGAPCGGMMTKMPQTPRLSGFIISSSKPSGLRDLSDAFLLSFRTALSHR